MNTYQGQLVGGEIRHGKVGFFAQAAGNMYFCISLKTTERAWT